MIRRIAILLLFAACSGGSSSTGIDVSSITCPPDSTLTYESYGQLVIEEHCLACHAGKESPRLGTVEEIRANKNSILREAVASTAMPDNSDMTLEERQVLGEWLACGAP
jgi:hypothetical protein